MWLNQNIVNMIYRSFINVIIPVFSILLTLVVLYHLVPIELNAPLASFDHEYANVSEAFFTSAVVIMIVAILTLVGVASCAYVFGDKSEKIPKPIGVLLFFFLLLFIVCIGSSIILNIVF